MWRKGSRPKSLSEDAKEKAHADLAAANAAIEAAEENVRVIRKYSEGGVLSDREQALLIGAIARTHGSVVDPVKLKNEMEAKAQRLKTTRDIQTPGS